MLLNRDSLRAFELHNSDIFTTGYGIYKHHLSLKTPGAFMDSLMTPL